MFSSENVQYGNGGNVYGILPSEIYGWFVVSLHRYLAGTATARWLPRLLVKEAFAGKFPFPKVLGAVVAAVPNRQ